MQKQRNARDWINALGLLPHPEGGFYKEVYRSAESVAHDALPERFKGNRSFATSIYYLLEGSDISRFHRIASDEIWHFYDGSPLCVHSLSADQGHQCRILGRDIEQQEMLQAVVPAGHWFGACLKEEGTWALVGCGVSPGFDFADFEIAERQRLLNDFPEHHDLIQKLTVQEACS